MLMTWDDVDRARARAFLFSTLAAARRAVQLVLFGFQSLMKLRSVHRNTEPENQLWSPLRERAVVVIVRVSAAALER
ncbi:hypothetical protein F2P81_020230 [Scophthalmus maximus]|uniref:Uncharacterized protein n=1 Tax=Scophthalmus maximus TaxID=52904 RepID=A0A6A4S4P1_SCOMX|nr:hypothetical protein F2P81_020230 [Scophthalmus maximus]